jgi:carbonic anhydrase
MAGNLVKPEAGSQKMLFVCGFWLLAFGLLLAAQSSHSEKHWGYSDEDGAIPPSKWGTLAGASLCGAGHQQSPIDLSTKAPAHSANVPTLDYHASGLSLVNNGHTVQANIDAGSAISVGSTTLTLAQFHFHAPSEHTVDGKHFPLEIHFVHVNDAGQPAAVLGVLVRKGHENAAIDPAMSRLPHDEGKTETLPSIDLAALPPSGGFWHYAGSLTTPPCTEGVQWYVMEHAIEMSSHEISEFTSLAHMSHTARPVQPVGDRQVERLER